MKLKCEQSLILLSSLYTVNCASISFVVNLIGSLDLIREVSFVSIIRLSIEIDIVVAALDSNSHNDSDDNCMGSVDHKENHHNEKYSQLTSWSV